MAYNILKTNKTTGFIANTQVYREELSTFNTNSNVFSTVKSWITVASRSYVVEIVGTCLDTTTTNESSSFRILAAFYTDGANNVTQTQPPNIVELENVTPNVGFQFTVGVGTINFQVHNGNADTFRWTIKASILLN